MRGEHSFDGGKTWQPNYEPPPPVLFRDADDPGRIRTEPIRDVGGAGLYWAPLVVFLLIVEVVLIALWTR